MLNLTKNGVDPMDILSSALNSQGWKVGGMTHLAAWGARPDN
jgi:hypothetical protein